MAIKYLVVHQFHGKAWGISVGADMESPWDISLIKQKQIAETSLQQDHIYIFEKK